MAGVLKWIADGKENKPIILRFPKKNTIITQQYSF